MFSPNGFYGHLRRPVKVGKHAKGGAVLNRRRQVVGRRRATREVRTR